MTITSHFDISVADLAGWVRLSVIGGMLSLPLLAQTSFAVQLGEEEPVLGPGSSPMDSPLFTLQNNSNLRIYTANGSTSVYQQTQLFPLRVQPVVGLGAGPSGSFDGCGAWLLSAHASNTGKVLGWYHAETGCNYSLGITHKSMAFAESSDGGTRWVKPNYPANQILTAWSGVANDPANNSVGDGHVLQYGSYHYLFFWAAHNYGVHVARSAISNEGRPGSWWKYYSGSFSQPGIGGNSTPISPQLLNTFVVYNSYLNRFIAVPAFGRWGFSINQSRGTDLLTWSSFPLTGTRTIYPLVSYNEDMSVDQGYNRSHTSLQYYNYPSLISPEGNSKSIGQTFYLYYVKLFPGEDFTQRYQMRRKVTLLLSPSTRYLARVALSLYQRTSGQTKLSTEIARPREGYAFVNTVGYLLSYPESGFSSLYECYLPSSGSYFLSTSDPASSSWAHCEAQDDRFVRRIGYISFRRSSEADLPLYRCSNIKDGSRFESTDAGCGGHNLDRILGYVLSKGLSPSL